MCSYINRYAIVTGGCLGVNVKNSSSTFSFDTWKERWSELPSFNSERHGHSSCALGDYVYIFAGQQDFRLPDCISSFERLRLDVDEEYKQWEFFMVPEVRALGYN